MGLAADDGEPVDGAVLVGVDAEVREVGEGLGALGLVEGAEEGVAAAVEPGGGEGKAVADQGGEFEVRVAGPGADFGDFGGGEEAVVCVAADEVGLFADGEAVVADLGGGC